MLRRKSTKSKQRRPLGRSKSTSCINQSRIKDLHSDPHVGQRDAQIAARLSYQRACNRKSEGMEGFLRENSSRGIGTDDGRVSRHDFGRSGSALGQIDEANRPDLSRQQSVRFAGPASGQRRALASRASEFRLNPTITPGQQKPKDVEIRAVSTVGAKRDFSFTSPSAFNPMRLMQRSEDRSYSEQETVAAPSFDRRVRKSKSMFTALSLPDADDYCIDNGPARSQKRPQTSRYASLNKENTPLAQSDVHNLRTPKSTSFLRNRRQDQSSQASGLVNHEAAVRLARENFREQVEGQSRLKSRPSMFFGSKTRLTDSSMGFRKSLRHSSNNSAALSSAFSGDSLAMPKQGSLRKKARKVSSTIKTTLKGIFGRRTSGTSSSFTRGPLEAQDTDTDSCLNVELPPSNEEASMSRGPSRMASIHAVPSPYRMKSLRASLDTCGGEEDPVADDKSRVTSWTDSVGNTVGSHTGTLDLERQRLSVIKENGLHISHSGRLSQRNSQDDSVGNAISVDSQRIYSALMKRAREVKQRQDEERRQSVGEIRSAGKAPLRSSSVGQFDGRSWSPPTIRCVQPEDDVFQDRSKETSSVDHGSPRSILRHSQSCHQPITTGGCSPNPWSDISTSTKDSPGRASVSSRPDVDRARNLTQRTSAFFASPANHLFRTASPFRRALRESMKSEGLSEAPGASHKWDTEYLGSMSAVSLPTRRPSPIKSEDTGPELGAESVYSSMDEDGVADSSLVAKFPRPPQAPTHGDATIFVPPPAKAGVRQTVRDISTASSVEWKTWLSSHVSRLEGNGLNDKPTPWSSPGMFPRLGHIRENAEIESPSEPARSPFEMTGLSSDNTPLRSLAGRAEPHSNQQHASLPRRITPGDENEAPCRSEHRQVNTTRRAHTGQRGTFKSTPSMPTLNSRPTGASPRDDHAPLRQSASLNTLSQPSYVSKEELAKRRRGRMRVIGETGSSVKSSPGLSAAVERQFGKTVSGSPAPRAQRSQPSADSAFNISYEAGSTSREAQSTGSKAMVDSFLSSRRRRIEGGEVESGSSPAAFV